MNTNPTPEQILKAQAHRTDSECAKMVGVNKSTWGRWRKGEVDMPYSPWRLFNILIGTTKGAKDE